MSKDWKDATPDEIRDAKIQQLEESINHLKYCVSEALRYGYVQERSRGASTRAVDILDEEWSK